MTKVCLYSFNKTQTCSNTESSIILEKKQNIRTLYFKINISKESKISMYIFL